MKIRGIKIRDEDGKTILVKIEFRQADSSEPLHSLTVDVSDVDESSYDDPDDLIHEAYERARDNILPEMKQALEED